MARSYTDKTLKLLWGRAAGRCAVPTCRIEVFAEATDHDPVVTFGDIAHLHAHSDRGARSDPKLSAQERKNYDNLILLCKNCHTRIDGQKHVNSISVVRQLKVDHEAWVRASLPERGLSATGWHPLYLRGDFPFDTKTTTAAISPDYLVSPERVIQVGNDGPWPDADTQIAETTRTMLADADAFDYRVALFPLAPVSACLALGYRLTSRPHVTLFQYHRDARTWAWPMAPAPATSLSIEETQSAPSASANVCFLFHISAHVTGAAIDALPVAQAPRFHLRSANPSTAWLRHPAQITEATQLAREMFERARAAHPTAQTWHVFYAGPAPIAVAIGQQLNPTLTPRVQLYEFRQIASPQYQPSILIRPT